jgi:hypothetical protein
VRIGYKGFLGYAAYGWSGMEKKLTSRDAIFQDGKEWESTANDELISKLFKSLLTISA